MNRDRCWIFLSAVILTSFLQIFPGATGDELENILHEIQNEYKDFKMGDQKDIVLVLGNTGTGKTTVTLLISGAKLEAQRVDLGVFRIDLLNTTVTLKTTIPNFIVDVETNTDYYDCPGFGGSHDVVLDIIATRSIYDLLNFADNIKVLFTVDYESMQPSTGDHNGFLELAENAINLFKDVQKYGKGMGMVVTKAAKLTDGTETDEAIIGSVAGLIGQMKDNLHTKLSDTMTDEEQRRTEDKIKFSEIFLEQESNAYTRLNILRLVDRPGLLEKMDLIQREREAIATIVRYNLMYVPTGDNDFGYSLTDESKRHTAELLTKLDEQLDKHSSDICADLKAFQSQRKPFAKTIAEIKSNIGVGNFFELKSNADFIAKFSHSMESLGVEVNHQTFRDLLQSVGFMDFLEEINNVNGPVAISSKIKDRLSSCANELFHDVKNQLRTEVPRAIDDLKSGYIIQSWSDPNIISNLAAFFPVAMDETQGMNATILRLLLVDPLINDLATHIDFLDFLQMMSDGELSIQMARDLWEWADNVRHEIDRTLTDAVIGIFDTIKILSVSEEKMHHLNAERAAHAIHPIRYNMTYIDHESFETYVQSLYRVVGNLNLDATVKNQGEMNRTMEFLQTLTNGHSMPIPDMVKDKEHECRALLSQCIEWYEFLIKLRDHLMTHPVQVSNLRNEGTELMSQSMHDETVSRHAAEIGIGPILQSLYPRGNDDIPPIIVNMYKLKALQAIWMETMSEAEHSCVSPTEILVKGVTVALSKVIKLECWETATRIEIFALSKVFFDADIWKDSSDAEISIIAPSWEIILARGEERRYISLKGKNGENQQQAKEAKPGLPGNPGLPGGSIFGFAFSYHYEWKLEIDVSGGNGGTGQEGGKGTDGIEGESPPRPPSYEDNAPDYEPEIYRKGFKTHQYPGETEHRDGFSYDKYTYFDVFGKSGTQGSSGADGGCGGYGGNPGIISIVGLSEEHLDASTGYRGSEGKGGRGGAATKNGKSYYVLRNHHNRSFRQDQKKYKIIRETDGDVVPAGGNGVEGDNCEDIKDAKNATIHIPRPIRRYQEYVREHLAKTTMGVELNHFLEHLTNSVDYDSHYDVFELIDDFTSLESQYFHLRNELNMKPFYEALKSRIERRVTHIGESIDERKTVKLLYTAVISKLISIEHQGNQIAVTNLVTHIDTIKVNIDKLNENKRIEYITAQRDSYKGSLDQKMSSANEMVEVLVVPAIEKTFADTEQSIQDLLEEAVGLYNDTADALEKAKENKRKMEKSMVWNNILAPFKVIGDLLSLAGPKGAIAGSVFTKGTSFVKSIVDGNLEPQKITTPAGPYEKMLKKIRKNYMRQQTLMLEQLNDLNKILSVDSSNGFDELRVVVDNVTSSVNKSAKFEKNYETDVREYIKSGKEVIDGALDKAKTHYEGLEKKGQDVKTQLERIKKMEKLMKVADIGVDVYKQNRDDNKKLDEMNKQITELQDQLDMWKEHEERIKEVMLPQLRAIEESFNSASKSLSGKTHVELDISKWKMQSALSDLKKLFSDMAKAQESVLEGDLLHCVEKIVEGITTMINVYDRIDSYVEQSKMVSLISDVALGSADIADERMRKAAVSLDKIVRTNLVLERFESVMQAMKQHKFPYARRFMNAFYKFPPDLQSTDTESVTQTVISNIDDLRNALLSSGASLETYDVNRFSDTKFDQDRPFYTWDHQHYESEIRKLMGGEPVTLQADIIDGLNYTAVKFKEVSINLKLENSDRQRELDRILENFEIVMKMVGENYYRCNNRIYYVSMDKEVVLVYHLDNGKVVGKNDLYATIYNSDYFLSPYTTWKIQLTTKMFSPTMVEDSEPIALNATNIFGELSQFRNERIDLQLTGVGQIIKNKVQTSLETCNDDLDNYYYLDKIV